MQNKCKYCGYEWEGRKKKPKACPACKRYFPLADFQNLNKARKNDKPNKS